jgi:hypothetical protein
MRMNRTTSESARTIGVAVMFGAAFLVAMVAASSSQDGGLLPLSDDALALDLPEHCEAKRTLSGIAIACDDAVSAPARAPLPFEESDGSVSPQPARSFETALH